CKARLPFPAVGFCVHHHLHEGARGGPARGVNVSLQDSLCPNNTVPSRISTYSLLVNLIRGLLHAVVSDGPIFPRARKRRAQENTAREIHFLLRFILAKKL